MWSMKVTPRIWSGASLILQVKVEETQISNKSYIVSNSYPFISGLGTILCRTLGDGHPGHVEAVEGGHHQRPLQGVY